MSSLLQLVPEDEQHVAAAVLGGCPRIALPAGTVRAAGRIPDAPLLVVEDGLVLVTSVRPAATRRMIVALAGPGSFLLPLAPGERLGPLIDSSITAVQADAYARLLALPGAARAIAEGLALELRERQDSLAQFSSVRHVERVREKLLQLARSHGRVSADGIRLDLPLTHELVGEMVGSARETVTWAFGQLAREGFLRREGRSYRLAVAPGGLA
ncbi:MAG TPA: Crp/Fnr family transcriptional regulator [Gaiellaceae bacterium]|jgi:CRP-like cAMP-binding protein